MLVHLRLTVPDDLTARVRDLLTSHDWITNVTVQQGACIEPAGDLVECDVAKEEASALTDELHELGARRARRHRDQRADRDAVRGPPNGSRPPPPVTPTTR